MPAKIQIGSFLEGSELPFLKVQEAKCLEMHYKDLPWSIRKSFESAYKGQQLISEIIARSENIPAWVNKNYPYDGPRTKDIIFMDLVYEGNLESLKKFKAPWQSQ